MDVLKTPSSTRKKLCSLTTTTTDPTNLKAVTRSLCHSAAYTDTRPMKELFRSRPRQSMVTFGLMISVTGFSMPSTLTNVPRPELRGQVREPRPGGGRHQPGEEGGPRDRGERERGDANTTSTSAAAAVFVMSHALHLTICIDIHQSINITPTIHNALACS